jgi:hypothetical protein
MYPQVLLVDGEVVVVLVVVEVWAEVIGVDSREDPEVIF